MDCRKTQIGKHQAGFEVMAAALWLLAFGSVAFVSHRFLADRLRNFSKLSGPHSLSSAQAELQSEHERANQRKWRSDDPRNKKWNRKLRMQKTRRGGQATSAYVEQQITFDPSPL